MIAIGRTSDDVLARRAGAGDDDAFATLFERHAGALYRYCRSIVHHDQDAQDAVQNTMVGALAALRRAPLEAPLRPWLFRIGHNESISLLRRRKPADDLQAQHALTAAPIERQLEDRERMSSLLDDLRELPERQRSALVMRELSGLSHEEISVALAIPVAATKQAIFDARRGLQAAEEGRRMTCDPVQRAISDGDGRVLRARQMRAHLRSCPACTAMRDAIATREKDLAALIPPLPAFAASALLARALEGAVAGGSAAAGGLGAAGGGAGAGAVAGTAAAAAKAGGLSGIALSGKALAIAAAILTAGTAGTLVVERAVTPSTSTPARASAPAGGDTLAAVGFGGGGAFSPLSSSGPSPSAPSGSPAPAAVAPGAGASPGTGNQGTGAQLPAVPAAGSSGGTGTTGTPSTPEQVAGAVTRTPSTAVDTGRQTAGDVTQAAGKTVTGVVENTTQAASDATQSAGDTAAVAKQTADTVVGTATDALPQVPGGTLKP